MRILGAWKIWPILLPKIGYLVLIVGDMGQLEGVGFATGGTIMTEPQSPGLMLPDGQVLIYRDGALNLQVRLDGRTAWLTQRMIAELYQVSVKTVNEHLVNIYRELELEPKATIRKFRIVQLEGNRNVTRTIDHYNLDAILAVGYRVRSHRGTQFRQWATSRLSELLVKGFTLDDERIKAGRTIGQDYFDELLERIRDIRASERLFYQKITDIYATSICELPFFAISESGDTLHIRRDN
jgi:hypothetical protein